jgi:uncharacterized membrane protein
MPSGEYGTMGGVEMHQSEAEVWVPLEVGVVWSFVSDDQNYPEFLHHLVAVEKLGDQTSQWYLRSKGATPPSLKVVSRHDLAREVSWQTLPGQGSIECSGSLKLEPEGSGTVVRLHYEYRPLSPAFQADLAQLFADSNAERELNSLRLHLHQRQHPIESEDADPVGATKPSATSNPLESDLVNKGR